MDQITPVVKEKRKRATKSPEFLAMRAKVQGFQYHLRKEDKIENPHLYVKEPKIRGHNLKRDKSGNWTVGVANSVTKKKEWLSTETGIVEEALQVVDDIGVKALSDMARDGTDKYPVVLSGENMLFKHALPQWRDELKARCSRQTVNLYMSAVNQFMTRCKLENTKLSMVKRLALHEFLNSGYFKENTLKLWRIALRQFFTYAVAIGACKTNIAADLRINKSRLTNGQRTITPEVPFTEAEYRLIMASKLVPPYWRYATALSYWLGLRPVDIARFEWSSIGEDYVKLYPQKTGRELIIPLSDPLLGSGELKEIFTEMKTKLYAGSIYCFPYAQKKYPGHPFKYFVPYHKVLQRCGVDNTKNFYGWRHTFRLRLTASGKSIEEVSRLMGHCNIGVTMGYGRKVEPMSPYIMGVPASLQNNPTAQTSQPPAAASAPPATLDSPAA